MHASTMTIAAGLGLGLAAVASAGTEFLLTTLVMEGDEVTGVGLVTSINNIAINDAGDWRIEVDTDHPDTDADAALIGPGGLLFREGQGLDAPAGATLDSFDSVTLNNGGSSGFNFFLDGTSGSGDDSGVYLDGLLKLQESAISSSPAFSPGTEYIGFFDVKINDGLNLLVTASIDDPAISSGVDRALVVLQIGAPGAAPVEVVVNKEGDVLPGQTEPVEDFGTGVHQTAYNNAEQVLFFANLAGDAGLDGAIYLADGADRLLLAQEGSASPVADRNWSSLSSPEVDLSNNGHTIYSGSLDGDSASNLLIVRDGAKFVQEGDAAPPEGGSFVFTSFGSGPLHVSDGGDVLWYGDWDDPDTDVDSALFFNDRIVIQEGSTVGGMVVDTVRGVEDGYDLSDNGLFAIVEVVFEGGVDAAILVEIVPPPVCQADLDGCGTVDSNDLNILLSSFGNSLPDPVPGDVDGDGDVDSEDLNILLGEFGSCFL